jgi:cellulose biosynthesis protein BcsQ
MAKVVVVCQRKGGSGKTTLAVTLAATGVCKSLHHATPGPGGLVLVDLDAQSNATAWALGLDALPKLGRGSTAAILAHPPMREYDFSEHAKLREPGLTPARHIELVKDDCIFPSPLVPGLAVVPMTTFIHPEDCRGLLLKELPFDTVVVDTMADGSTPAVRSALQQADYVVVPTVPEPWGLLGVRQIRDELLTCGRDDLLRNGGVCVVINNRQKTRMHDQFEQQIRKEFHTAVAKEVLQRCAATGMVSVGPQFLDKKSAVWKACVALWRDIGQTIERRAAA